jgi:hypothetical protein
MATRRRRKTEVAAALEPDLHELDVELASSEPGVPEDPATNKLEDLSGDVPEIFGSAEETDEHVLADVAEVAGQLSLIEIAETDEGQSLDAKAIKAQVLDKRFQALPKINVELMPTATSLSATPQQLQIEDALADFDQGSAACEEEVIGTASSKTVVVEVETLAPGTEGNAKNRTSSSEVTAGVQRSTHSASSSGTSTVNAAILAEDSKYTIGQLEKGGIAQVSTYLAKNKQSVACILLGFSVLLALSFAGSWVVGSFRKPQATENIQPNQPNPLAFWADGYAFGYQQDPGNPPHWWIATITPIDANHFTIVWNGEREQGGGQGTGIGSGIGVIQSDGHVTITLDENIAATGGFGFSLGAQSHPTQIFQLKGRYVSQGSNSYFVGHDLRRGKTFNPSTTWVLMRQLPPGWRKPTTQP